MRRGGNFQVWLCCRCALLSDLKTGNAQVSGMYSEESTSFKHRYPIRAIALDPRYGQRKTREFVTGGDSGELVLHSRVGSRPDGDSAAGEQSNHPDTDVRFTFT